MTMDTDIAELRLQRFLAPTHVVAGITDVQIVGRADTPAADAECELYLTVVDSHVDKAEFALYGPPIAIACADWLCEAVAGRTIASVRGLSMQTLVSALALVPEERYSAMLVFDALSQALDQLSKHE